MECLIIIGNGIVDAVVSLCVEKIYKKIKNKFSNTNNQIETVHLNFRPQKSDEDIEEIIIKKKKKKKVNFAGIETDTETDYDTDKDINKNKLISTNNIK